jgi:hypothetical protein
MKPRYINSHPMPPIPVTATATLSSFEIASIIVVKESNSARRPCNLHLLYSPGPSKNFLFIGKGQLEDVGEGSQSLFVKDQLVSK